MNIARYYQRRAEWEAQQPVLRQPCHKCLQPEFSCFCAWLTPFDPGIKFIILTHPIEVKRRIATGRMSHLILKNSHLIRGHDYSRSAELNGLLTDPTLHCVMLYPGRLSRNLSSMTVQQRHDLVPEGRRLAVIVIDGTWSTARKMVHLSRNIKSLPRICFTPPGPSRFRVRRQPRPECYSTIEAIHHTLELFSESNASREHDCLLHSFDRMVERQIELSKDRPSRRRTLQVQV